MNEKKLEPDSFALDELLKYCSKVRIAEKDKGRNDYWIEIEGLSPEIVDVFDVGSSK